ncbi:hypothetical protein ES705_46034 [subsurface metagenome]
MLISWDGGQTWEDPIWTFGEIGVWDDWTWYETIIDLSAFNKNTVNIAFNIRANDNADIALDNVYIGDASEKNKDFGTHAISVSFASDLKGKRLSYIPEISIFSGKNNKATLLNYTVYRDDAEIAETPEKAYLDESVPLGLHTYYVTAIYDNPPGISDPSNEVEVNIIEVGIDTVGTADNILLYPNPSSGVFTIVVDRKYTLTILNIQGIVEDEFIVDKHTLTIDLSEHPEGIYVLRFRDNETIYTKKIVIK